MMLSDYASMTDKHITHNYCRELYNDLFKPYENKRISLLEIGIMHGGSMAMWHQYFKNARRIVGIDRDTIPKRDWEIYTKALPEPPKNVELLQFDAYNPELTSNLGAFDIIIDDGPHTLASHMLFLALYLPKLKKGGLLIIEDVRKPEWFQAYEGLLALTPFKYRRVDLRPKETADDLLFIVEWK
jgi:hypothetical protein